VIFEKRPMNWLQKLSEQMASKGISPGDSVNQARFADPYYRFQNFAEVAQASQLGIKIDVNRASVDDWLRLPGISIHQAKSLVQLSHGGMQFYAIEDVAAALGLSVQRLQPLTPILQFCYYDPSLRPQLLNANSASVEDLLTIPGMEPAIAHQLVRERVTAGTYQNLSQLQQRLNLSGTILEQLLHYLQF
jgi:DNA uptake protein ComE-like DNA-binding protein